MSGEENLVNTLMKGGVVVMPTDTVYGIVGRALDVSVVEKIYKIRRRAGEKPCIILISDISELGKFSIELSKTQKEDIEKYWPGPVSIIFECSEERFAYLHRGTKTLAFRLPVTLGLIDLLKLAGPLIAPSANPEGESTAQNITEAKNYFGDLVEMYIDGGTIVGEPSKVIKMDSDGSITVIRK